MAIFDGGIGGLHIASWPGDGRDPVVIGCSDARGVAAAWRVRLHGKCALVFLAGEPIRRPTRWEHEVSVILATPAAAALVGSVLPGKPLPDELDSGFVALEAGLRNHRGTVTAGPVRQARAKPVAKGVARKPEAESAPRAEISMPPADPGRTVLSSFLPERLLNRRARVVTGTGPGNDGVLEAAGIRTVRDLAGMTEVEFRSRLPRWARLVESMRAKAKELAIETEVRAVEARTRSLARKKARRKARRSAYKAGRGREPRHAARTAADREERARYEAYVGALVRQVRRRSLRAPAGMDCPLLDEIEASLAVLDQRCAYIFARFVGWDGEAAAGAADIAGDLGITRARVYQLGAGARERMDGVSGWPDALATEARGLEGAEIRRLADRWWAAGLSPDQVGRLVNFARLGRGSWERRVHKAEAAALTMPGAATASDVAWVALSTLGEDAGELGPELLAAMGLEGGPAVDS